MNTKEIFMDTETKIWWQSRTVWTGLVGALFAILHQFGMLPVDLTTEMVLNMILGIVSVLAVVFRVDATKKLTIK